LDRSADEAGIECVNGQLVEKPVSIESSELEAHILGLLILDANKARRVKVFASSLGYKVYSDPKKFRKPDISAIRVERMAGIDRNDGFMRISADLVVEVLSPGDLAYEVSEKVAEYLEHGFHLIWVVQPNTRTVVVYRLDGTVALLHENDTITGEDVLPEFRHLVSELFDVPVPNAS
jgi:Uma2 family endonuclease